MSIDATLNNNSTVAGSTQVSQNNQGTTPQENKTLSLSSALFSSFSSTASLTASLVQKLPGATTVTQAFYPERLSKEELENKIEVVETKLDALKKLISMIPVSRAGVEITNYDAKLCIQERKTIQKELDLINKSTRLGLDKTENRDPKILEKINTITTELTEIDRKIMPSIVRMSKTFDDAQEKIRKIMEECEETLDKELKQLNVNVFTKAQGLNIEVSNATDPHYVQYFKDRGISTAFDQEIKGLKNQTKELTKTLETVTNEKTWEALAPVIQQPTQEQVTKAPKSQVTQEKVPFTLPLNPHLRESFADLKFKQEHPQYFRLDGVETREVFKGSSDKETPKAGSNEKTVDPNQVIHTFTLADW